MTDKQETPERVQQLVHSARQMFETRLAKYNDPHNLDWDFEDVTDKWERHAFSAFMDLQAAESEIERLRANHATELQQARRDVWREAIETAQKSTKRSLAAGLDIGAAEILIRRLELAAEKEGQHAE